MLGTETDEVKLTEAQKKLREAADEQWKGHWDGRYLERPDWANGVSIYLKPEHAAMIRYVLDAEGVQLQSKHVLLSEELLEIVEVTLRARPVGPGREVFLKQRAGAIRQKTPITLPSADAGAANENSTHIDPESKKWKASSKKEVWGVT